MLVVKVKTVPTLVKVAKKEFEEATDMQKPFYEKANGNGADYRPFAQCPNCDNPVQLINLYNRNAKVAPHAKHYLKSVEGLAKFVLENYELCHWRKDGNQSKKKRSLDNPLSQAIVNQLISNFDQVVYFLEKETGMHFGKPLLTAYLEEYFGAKKWLFYSAGLLNIPLVLVEGSVAKLLNGRVIFNNSELIAAIEKATGIPIVNGKIGFFPKTAWLYFSFQLRKVDVDTGIEEIHFRASMNKKRIYDKTIVLDPSYMQNLYAYPRDKLSTAQKEKSSNHLDLAKTIAAKYGFFDEK